MYLSRIELDIQRGVTMRMLASPSRIHGVIETALSGERKRNLWRVDKLHGKTYLLLLSENKPDFREAAELYSPENSRQWMTKDYSALTEKTETGTSWRFRLAANTVKSLSMHEARGEVKACGNIEGQKAWLKERAGKKGFSVDEEQLNVVESGWKIFSKGREHDRKVSIRYAVFEGVLTVTDEAVFRETLVSGIGRGKAYGMGLLTLARIR